MKLLLLPLLVLGLAASAFAADPAPTADKPKEPACQCGAKSADDCHKHCGDKCGCTKAHCNAPEHHHEAKK